MIVAVVSPDQDRRRPIHHRGRDYHYGRPGHDHGCGVHDGRRWGSNHDWRRCDDHRQPDTNGYPNPCMDRERQDKGCYP